MKKIIQFCAALAVAMGVAGCYNDFDMPAPRPAVTDADFADMERISIADVKQLFLDEHKSISDTGSNSSWNDTKYTLIGQSESGKDYYIKGKVQSSDEEGNIYKSLHLVDETGAIEVKLSTGLYIDYPMGTYDKATGTIPTHWVYVKVTGLYVGNYRMMLSIGSAPTDSYNKVGEHKFYANSNIENPTEIAQRVFLGEETELKLGEEILEIDESNYGDYFGEAGQQYLGRLVLIKGVTCHYGEVDSNLYPSWMCTDLRPVESKDWYKWAVNENFYSNTSQKNLHCNFYGSVLFSYVGLPTQTMTKGVFVVRTSGYSRFAKQPVVRGGGKGDILAILGIYAKYWTQSYGAYQCSISHFDDLMFEESEFLTDAEAEVLAPAGSDSWTTNLSANDYEE